MTDQWRLETHFRDRFPYDGSLTPQVPGSHVHVTARSSTDRVSSVLSQTATISPDEELRNAYLMPDDKISLEIIIRFLRNPHKIQQVSVDTLNFVFQGLNTPLNDGDTLEIKELIHSELERRKKTQGNIFTRR